MLEVDALVKDEGVNLSRSAKDGPRLPKCFLYIRSYWVLPPDAVMGGIPDIVQCAEMDGKDCWHEKGR